MDNPCQKALFKAMSKPELYPHPVRYVAQKETHDDLEKQVAERTAELRRTNKALLKAREAAEDASQAKGEPVSDLLICT